MKGGEVDTALIEQYFSNDDKRVKNNLFQEYARIVDEQTGSVKRKIIEQSKEKKYSLPAKMKMKKTLFKKYPSDKFNFYQPPIKEITRIFDLTSVRDHRRFNESRKFSQKYTTVDASKISTLNSERNAIQRFNSETIQCS